MARSILTKSRTGFVLSLIALSAVCLAQDGSIKLTTYPEVALADGNSPIVVTVEVRDSRGALVPDGTIVVFDSKEGTFEQSQVATQSGIARTTLRAPGLPAKPVIRATVLTYNASAERRVEFVAERSQIEGSLRPVEIEGESALTYSVQDRVFEAAGRNHGASLKYGGVIIEADELQFAANEYRLRARNCIFKSGDVEQAFDELWLDVKTLDGIGFGPIVEPGKIIRSGAFAFYKPSRQRRAYQDIQGGKISLRTQDVDDMSFRFVSVVDSVSIVTAKRATLVQDRAIQFQRAALRVNGTPLFKQPYFELPLYATTQSLNEQFVSVNNNQLAINVPYYVGLNPGSTSLLRMRYSSPFSGGSGYAAGTYLDYELNWNQGDAGSGAFTVGGIGRDDWGLSLRQSWISSARTLVTASVDSPSHSSLLGNVSISQPFKGSSMSLNYGYGTSISGEDYTSDSLSFLWSTDPRRLGNSKIHASYGLTASKTNTRLADDTGYSYSAAGIQARLHSDSVSVGSLGRARATYRIAQLYRDNGGYGTAHNFALGLTTNLAKGWVLDTAYDYNVDPFAIATLGQHRITTDSYFYSGPWNLRGSLIKSLDFARTSTRLSVGRRISGLWRLDYSNAYDLYQGTISSNQLFSVGYRLGIRELGLTYSQRTNRLGIEIRAAGG